MRKPAFGKQQMSARVVQSELAALAVLDRNGAGGTCDDSGHVVSVDISAKPNVNDFIHVLGWMPFLQTIRAANSPISDAGMTHLRQLERLETVYASYVRFSGDSLENLENCTRLRAFFCDVKQAADRGAELLARMTSIEELSLSRSDVSEEGLRYVGKMRRLEKLSLTGTSITTAGVRALAPLGRKLKELTLEETSLDDNAMEIISLAFPCLESLFVGSELTDRGVSFLGKMDSLKVLGLSSRRISDSGLQFLGAMPGLQELIIGRTSITDAGLVSLYNAASLRLLWAHGSLVSDEGLRKLKAHLPLCDVGLDDPCDEE